MTADAASRALPDLPADAEGRPAFREPWEAQAFALAVALEARGLFTWGEWAVRLGQEIARAQAAGDPDHGDTYYRHWLSALERLLDDRGVADPETRMRTQRAWAHAAARVPHGQPIDLRPEDFHAGDHP